MARPNVLMFGDVGWGDSRTSAQESRFEAWLADVTRMHGRLAIVECAAGMAIPTVRRLVETLARQSAAILVRINPRDPRRSDGGDLHRGRSAPGPRSHRGMRDGPRELGQGDALTRQSPAGCPHRALGQGPR
jgi:hypothetical protein